MFAPGLHPLYAVGSIAALALVGDVFRRVIPFYRRELAVEAATRLTPLDGLRGILCFAVMYHHAAIERAFFITGRWEETPSVFYVLLGQTAVAFFFCITAFLFWGRALDRKGDIPPIAFLRGRWFRIVPLYVFTCVAALFLVRTQIHWSHHATWLALGKMALMGLVTWGKIGNTDVNMINGGVTWTLQYEWAFYIALPALAILLKAGSGWRILLLALAFGVVQGIDKDVDFKSFFLVGILAAHVARMPVIATVLRKFYVSIVALGILIVMPLIVNGGYYWLPLILTTLVFVPIACGNSMFGILNYAGLRLLGTISYSVYLLHGMFLYVGRPYLQQALQRGDHHYWVGIFATAYVVLVFCSMTYRWIEWPFIQLEKRLRQSGGSA